MPRSASRKKPRPAASRKPLSKGMLLPIPAESARRMSLANHLALAACRREGGANSHLINELLEALYIAFYLQELGVGDESPELYAEAELAMNAVLTRAEAESVLVLDAEAAAIMERVLRLHDAQLNAISLRHLQDAQKRLDRYIQSGEPSPLLTNALKEAAAPSPSAR